MRWIILWTSKNILNCLIDTEEIEIDSWQEEIDATDKKIYNNFSFF